MTQKNTLQERHLVELAKLIHRKRNEKGLSIPRVAEETGVSDRYVTLVECEEKPYRPSFGKLIQLDLVLDLGKKAYRLAGYSKEFSRLLKKYKR